MVISLFTASIDLLTGLFAWQLDFGGHSFLQHKSSPEL
jgi:hypothetical protein